jgi:choline dehydrogenase-like flavoprotein
MIIDTSKIAANTVIQTDICIVGAGPAGLTLVRELLGQSLQICVLESGGLQPPDPATAALGDPEILGDFQPNDSPTTWWYDRDERGDLQQVARGSRHRQFGGNSNVWGINLPSNEYGLRLMPFAAADFEARSHIPYSGWAFDRNHLDPYYERAHKLLQIGACQYDAKDWTDADSPALPLQGDRLTNKVFQFCRRTVFYQDCRQLLEKARNVTTYLHANVMALETDELGQTVQRVKVASLEGKSFWIDAKIVILATGGLENAQLLLLSNQVQPKGLGNDQDLVGRFFMDHPLIYGGRIIPNSSQIFNQTAFYDLRQVKDAMIMGHLAIGDEALRQGATNLATILYPRHKDFRFGKGLTALKAMLTFNRLQQPPYQFLNYAGEAIAHLDELTVELTKRVSRQVFRKLTKRVKPVQAHFPSGGWSYRQANPAKDYQVFEVIHQTEQLPHPDNRVMLSSQRDALGRPRIAVQTRWRDADLEGIRKGQTILAEEFAKTGLGVFQPEWNGDRPFTIYAGAAHHMGTTRMSVDPKLGVVDEQCRVHSVNNLYVAGSSVFPTGGYANPTLTIVALSIRLADRIKAICHPFRSDSSEQVTAKIR